MHKTIFILLMFVFTTTFLSGQFMVQPLSRDSAEVVREPIDVTHPSVMPMPFYVSLREPRPAYEPAIFYGFPLNDWIIFAGIFIVICLLIYHIYRQNVLIDILLEDEEENSY